MRVPCASQAEGAASGANPLDDDALALSRERHARARSALTMALAANEQMERAAREAERRAKRHADEARALRSALIRAEDAAIAARQPLAARLPALSRAATAIQVRHDGELEDRALEHLCFDQADASHFNLTALDFPR